MTQFRSAAILAAASFLVAACGSADVNDAADPAADASSGAEAAFPEEMGSLSSFDVLIVLGPRAEVERTVADFDGVVERSFDDDRHLVRFPTSDMVELVRVRTRLTERGLDSQFQIVQGS